MIVIHLVLCDDGSWSIGDQEAVLVSHWESATGGKLLPWAAVHDRAELTKKKDLEAEGEAMSIMREPVPIVKKDMSAGKERGATVRARAEALLNDLGLARTKGNVAAVVEAMEALVQDYESMILELNSSGETARDKAGAWDRLVTMILTKGQ